MKPVYNTHSGLTVQNKVNLLLFLQAYSVSDFKHIVFEDDDWEDATLSFEDKNIFVEVKNITTQSIGLSYIKREVYSKFVGKASKLNDKDRILIAAPSIKEEVKNSIRSMEYLSDRVTTMLRKRKFTKTDISLLGKTIPLSFEDSLDRSIEVYLSSVMGFWLPDDELVEFKDYVIQEIVSRKSSTGARLTRQEFDELIERRRKQLKVGFFKDDVEIKVKVKEILSILTDPDQRIRNVENPRVLSSLMSSPMDLWLLLHAMEREIEIGKDVELSKWQPIWEAALHPAYSFQLLNIHEKFIKANAKNHAYFIDFWARNIGKLFVPLQGDYLVGHVLGLAHGILKDDPATYAHIFELVKSGYSVIGRSKFRERDFNDHKFYDLGQLAKLIEGIFALANNQEKKDLLSWCQDSFSLTRDSGKYHHDTPASIFILWRKYILESEPVKRLHEFILVVESDYLADPQLLSSKNKGESLYDGFDLWGSGISNNGGTYSIEDKAYVELVIKPVLKHIHETDPIQHWAIIESFVTTQQKDVGRLSVGKRPDFLSRAIIPSLIRIFDNDLAHAQTSFSYLCGFIRFRKGIPSRTELIFYDLMQSKLEPAKKWALVKFQLDLPDYKKTPANIFVEKIIQSLLQDGVTEVLPYVDGLIENELYLKYRRHDFYMPALISSMVQNPSMRASGIKLLETVLASKYFNELIDDFDAYDIKGPIGVLFEADKSDAISLLKKVADDKGNLSRNRQIAVTTYLRDAPDNEVLLAEVFAQVFQPILDRTKRDALQFAEYFDFDHAREEIAEFGGKLIKNKLVEEGLEILEVLANDPSPGSNEYADEMKGKNEFHLVQSVKAHAAHSLSGVVTLSGRDYLNRAFLLVEKLAKDKNVYIRSQACFPLSNFVQARHWHMPDAPQERYMKDIRLVKRIDKLTFNLLESKDNQHYRGLAKAAVHVISYMRALNTEDAKRVAEAVIAAGPTAIIDYLPTLFFFAEFRRDKEVFKNWQWNKDFPIHEFDDSYFRKLIKKNLCHHSNSEVRGSIAWTLWTMFRKDKVEDKKALEIIFRYIPELVSEYGSEWFDDIHYLVNDLREAGYKKEAIELWTQAFTTEIEAFKKAEDKSKFKLAGRYHDGEVLITIKEVYGASAFEKWLDEYLNFDQITPYLSNIKELYEASSSQLQHRLTDRYPRILIDNIQ